MSAPLEIIGLATEERENTITCDLCYEDSKEDEFYNLSCEHSYCKLCFEEYLENAIAEGKVMNIVCMSGLGCTIEFTEQNVRDCVSEASYQKYMRFLRNAKVDLDPNLRWCPEASCEGVVKKKKNVDIARCNMCRKLVCFSCGALAHEGRPCGESKKDEDFEKWKKESGAVNCPKCTITVYKFEGCNHMTCAFCNYQFCWACGASATAK